MKFFSLGTLSLVKAGHINHDKESITMGVRNGKNYLTQIASFKNKDNGFDSIIYEMEKKRKFTEGGNTMKKIDVEKIIFNEFKTIVFWNDGTKTIVSMSQEERNFDPEDAFRAAYTKKMYGTNSKIKRIIAEKSNIEQHQRIVKEKLKEEMEKISRDYDKYMKEKYPWMYKDEEKKPEKQKDDERPIKFCQCDCSDDISKDRRVEEPDDQLYKLGLKALSGCEGSDFEAIERVRKEAEKFQNKLVQLMYETLTGHPYEGEENKNDEN